MTLSPHPVARWLPAGAAAALLAAALFGAGTPLAKALMPGVGPWTLAGLLYLGSGLGLALLRLVRRAPSARLQAGEWSWLAGAVLAGGVVGPVLLMFGLTAMPALGASLPLNADGVFTAVLAWFAFKENFDLRIALGILTIVAGAVTLSWPGEAQFGAPWLALAVLGACLAWGVDNNLTRMVSLADATWVAMVLPLALVGAVIGLCLAGQPLSVAALVGCITRAGISVRNDILKVSHYINLMRFEGENFDQKMILRGSL